MKGLIKKDFLLLKGNLTYFLIITIVFTLFSIQGTTFQVSFILPFIAIMMFISTFSWDDFNHWNAYAITLPVERKTIVKSKYISAIILIFISILIGLIIFFLNTVITETTFNIEYIFSEIAGSILAIVFVLAIWFPCIYKFGVEKGRIILFLGVFSVALLGSLASEIFQFSSLLNVLAPLENSWYAITFILSIIVLISSYFISKRIYLKKEY